MAAKTSNEELRRHVLSSLAEGRDEISAEMHLLRMQLSPARILHRMVERHTRLTVSIALVAGMVPAWLLLRSRPSRPVTLHSAKPETKSAIGPQLLGVLARAITPTLVKSALVAPLLKLLVKKQPDAVQTRLPD